MEGTASREALHDACYVHVMNVVRALADPERSGQAIKLDMPPARRKAALHTLLQVHMSYSARTIGRTESH
jgi:hypothetical protein